MKNLNQFVKVAKIDYTILKIGGFQNFSWKLIDFESRYGFRKQKILRFEICQFTAENSRVHFGAVRLDIIRVIEIYRVASTFQRYKWTIFRLISHSLSSIMAFA